MASSTKEDLIAELSAQLTSLRDEVQSLRMEIGAARGRVGLTMRAQLRCPACGADNVLRAPRVLDRSDSGRSKMALAQPSVWSSRAVGELEAWICGECGVVEWYVAAPEELEADGRWILEPPKTDGPDGPYR